MRLLYKSISWPTITKLTRIDVTCRILSHERERLDSAAPGPARDPDAEKGRWASVKSKL